jgi:hypothetical protein
MQPVTSTPNCFGDSSLLESAQQTWRINPASLPEWSSCCIGSKKSLYTYESSWKEQMLWEIARILSWQTDKHQ